MVGRTLDGARIESASIVSQRRVEVVSRQADLERDAPRRRMTRDVGDALLEKQEEMAPRLRIEPDVREIRWCDVRQPHPRPGKDIVRVFAQASTDAGEIVASRIDGPDHVAERIDQAARAVGDVREAPHRLMPERRRFPARDFALYGDA